MRRMLIGLACAAAFAAGCGGGSEETPPPAVPATTSPPPAAAATDGAYELDVIVEGEPDEGAPPLTVRFEGFVEEDEGGPWKFSWDFGDGTGSTEQNPVHTYQKEGDYTATLTVTDQRGFTGEDEIDIFVETDE